MGFYQNIRHEFGDGILAQFKEWSKSLVRLCATRNQRIFLLRCRSNSVMPPHIVNRRPTFSIQSSYQPGRHHHMIALLERRVDTRVLSLEIKLCNDNILYLEKYLDDIIAQLRVTVPHSIIDEFKVRQDEKYRRAFLKLRSSQTNKFVRALTSQKSSTSIPVESHWLKNLTTLTIPDNVKTVLSLGPKFSYDDPSSVKLKPLLADIDSIIRRIGSGANIIAAQATNVLTNFASCKKVPDDPFLSRDIYETKRFLKEHPEVMVTKSDKGNVTVLLYTENYRTLCWELSSDRDNYEILSGDPTNLYQGRINRLVARLSKDGKIDSQQTTRLMTYGSVSPGFYALPKIHKPSLSVRPIISCIDAPNSKLSRYISGILTLAYDRANRFYLKDSFEFSSFIRGYRVPEGYVMASFDVVSLFTNITVDSAIEAIQRRWNVIRSHCMLGSDEFTKCVRTIFDTTYCTFQNTYYKQRKGTPMGADISPILAQMVVDDLLCVVVERFPTEIVVIKKYVDDSFCIVQRDRITDIINFFNNLDDLIKFTFELEVDNRLPYSDVSSIRDEEGVITTDWYMKPMASGRFLNFRSAHRREHKINSILGLKNRINRIASEDSVRPSSGRLHNLLLSNSYPIRLVNKLLYNTPTTSETSGRDDEPTTNVNIRTVYASIPFFRHITPELQKIFRNFETDQLKSKIANNIPCTIGKKVFTKLKDKIPTLSKPNVVYRINCGECTGSYIGQTSRPLSKRLYEHRNDCRNLKQNSGSAKHVYEEGHRMDFEGAQVIGSQKNDSKRRFLESVEIRLNSNSVNTYNESVDVSPIYCYLSELIKDEERRERSHVRTVGTVNHAPLPAGAS